MKKLVRITENDLHNIIIESIKNVLSEASDFEWPKYGLSNDELNACKKKAYEIADRMFPNEPPYKRIELLLRKTYKDYLIASNTNVSMYGSIDDYIKNRFKIIDNYGFGQYESTSLEQGWWYYICNKY